MMRVRVSNVVQMLSIGAAVLLFGSTGRASIIYGTVGNTLSQNFDSLASTAIASPFHTWSDDTTIDGWYSSRTVYNGGTGSSLTGNLYSYGVAGVNPNTDRALGSVASGTTGAIQYGIALQNTTGILLDSFTLAYVGEQWRIGSSPVIDPGDPSTFQRLAFHYGISSGLAGLLANAAISDTDLDFVGPKNVVGPPPATNAIDGNAGANRISLSDSITGISWGINEFLWLRWSDSNSAGDDHGFAIDDFSFSATGPVAPAAVPEPSSMAALALLACGIVAMRRFRRSVPGSETI